jgi:outer membrane protein assembly factor BamB
LWQVQQPGIPMGSPLVVGQRVYFSVNDTLYALERATGRLAWQLDLDSPIAAPLVYGADRLYVRTADGWLHAIE